MDNKEAIDIIRSNWPPANRTQLIEALELCIRTLEDAEELKPFVQQPTTNTQSTPCPLCGALWNMSKCNTCSCGAFFKRLS